MFKLVTRMSKLFAVLLIMLVIHNCFDGPKLFSDLYLTYF